MATIRDVARVAGVSVTTVSHVFSGRRKVAPATIQAVTEVAERLGYRPNGVARTLATGKSTTVGLHFEIGEDALLLNPFFSELLVGFAAASADYGFTFKLLPHDLDVNVDSASLMGALVVDPSPQNPWVPFLARRGSRIVTISRFLGETEVSSVDNDLGDGMHEVLDHLSEQGYHNLALISVRQRASYAVDIEAAFREGCDQRGLKGEVVFASDLSDRAARRVAIELLERRDPPTAIIGVIDHMALGVLHAAQEMGVAVPEALGVVGFNDTVLSRHAVPPLTTVRIEPEELAREALRLMHGFWLDPNCPDEEIRLPAQLVKRASTQRA